MGAGVGAAVGEGLGEGVGVGAGSDNFGSGSPVFSRCLTTAFISAFAIDRFSAFLGGAVPADLFSLFLFAADLSLWGEAPRGSLRALAKVFSLCLGSVTLRGLVATCWRGGGFVVGVTAGGVAPADLAVLSTTGLSVDVLPVAGD
jgi:hypothetical protein